MKKPDALEHFHGAKNYSCAQAVLKAYGSWLALEDACFDRFSRFGGGRAPGGECGALFAAKSLLQDGAAKQAVEDAFVRAAGDAKCHAIRNGRTFTCRQCVQTAADAVFAQLSHGHVLRPPTECGEGAT